MEVTGQAFEDMQEQNSRLIQQLREKDDANFKLMSERIKSNQVNNYYYLIFIFNLNQVNKNWAQFCSKIHLIQQLREKVDANFKLMSERIKSNQVKLNF